MVPHPFNSLEPSGPGTGTTWSGDWIRLVRGLDTPGPGTGTIGSGDWNFYHPFVFTFFSKYLRRALASRFTRRMITMSTSAVP